MKARKRQVSFTGTVDGDKMTGTIFSNWQMSWTDQNGDPMQALFQIQRHGSKLSGSFEARRGSAPFNRRRALKMPHS